MTNLLEKRRRRLIVAWPPWGMERESLLRIHSREVCVGPCPFHKPTKHHMRSWKMTVRLDRVDKIVERKCPHGCGHPDPDSLAFATEHVNSQMAKYIGFHGCDGCCSEPK